LLSRPFCTLSLFLACAHTSGLERALLGSKSLRLEELCIIPGKQCWVLHVDAVVLDSGGNLLDAIVLAARAALKTTQYCFPLSLPTTPPLLHGSVAWK
jgi:exosome complex RNA-binding protein Rrp42 (RNase PH superfamily)